MKIKFSFLVVFILFCFLGQAQKEKYMEGLEYYKNRNYEKALEFFYADKYASGNKDLLIRRIISNYNVGNLENAKKDVSAILAFDNVPDETYLYIAKIFHSELKFKKAAVNYKTFLKKLSAKDERRDDVIHTIKQCGKSVRMKYKEPIAFVDNYGPDINTKYDEFRMIQSPNYDSKYYFTSAREGATGGLRDEKGKKDLRYGMYNSDMYTIEMTDGKWLPATPLNELLNTSRDEMALDFSADGSVLFYMKGPDYTKGSIYTDTFKVNKTPSIEASRLAAPIYAENGDTYLNMFNNSTIIFASNREGGYGGSDLYVTTLVNGQWSRPKNLGSAINSKYDEIAPFISNDGNTIFFSSNRVESFGGYDVFYSEFDISTNNWKTSKNMGLPVNSAGDDIDFYVNRDGFAASLSSDRKKGYGGFDLYVVYFKNQQIGQLHSVKDLAFIRDDKFIPSTNSIASNNRRPQSSKASTNPSEKEPSKKNSKKARKKKNKKSTLANNNSKKKADTASPSKKKDAKKSKLEVKSNPVETKKKMEYIINPLYYSSNDEIISAANKRELEILVNLLTMYPSLHIEIRAHTVEEGLEAYDLYFSIKRAETVGDYLVSKGVNPNSIHLKGYGSNYPVAKSETGGKKSKIAQKVNSRIEFNVTNIKDLPISINIVEPYLVDYLRDSRGALFKTIEDGLSYRVQIAAVKQMYQNQVLLLYNDSMIEKEMDNKNFRYTLGLYEEYKNAKDLIKDLMNYNITGAFVVPYIDGQRINKDEYVKFAEKYPDLLNFIQYNDE